MNNLKTFHLHNEYCSEAVWIKFSDFLQGPNKLTTLASFSAGMRSRALAKHVIASLFRAPSWREFKYSSGEPFNEIIKSLREGGFITILPHATEATRVAKPLIR